MADQYIWSQIARFSVWWISQYDNHCCCSVTFVLVLVRAPASHSYNWLIILMCSPIPCRTLSRSVISALLLLLLLFHGAVIWRCFRVLNPKLYFPVFFVSCHIFWFGSSPVFIFGFWIILVLPYLPVFLILAPSTHYMSRITNSGPMYISVWIKFQHFQINK